MLGRLSRPTAAAGGRLSGSEVAGVAWVSKEPRPQKKRHRDFAALVAEWRTDCDNQPAPKPRGERGLESQVDSAVALIEEGQISRGVRFLHSAAQGLGVAGLDEEGVLEQLRLKHPRRRTPVPVSYTHLTLPTMDSV